jgi:hypothetical protein
VGGLVDIFLFRRRRDPTLEPGPGASPRPELWFCPSPGTPDWKSLANPATFAMLANDCDALQLYQDQLLDAPMPPLGLPRSALPPHGWNTWRAFRDWGILRMAASHGLPLSVESAGLKEWSADPLVYASRITESARVARALGCGIHAVSFDEPWNAGFNIRQPAWPFEQIVAHLTEVRRLVHDDEPGIEIGFIEPYPTIGVDTLCASIEAFAPAFFHVDIDYLASSEPHLSRLCKPMSAAWPRVVGHGTSVLESLSGATKRTRPRRSCVARRRCSLPFSTPSFAAICRGPID